MAQQSNDEREFDVTGELSEDGYSLIIHHAQAMRRLWNGFGGKVLRIRFAIFRQKRSDAQNRYIHGVVVPTVKAWYRETQGETKTNDEIYVWLRVGLLGQKPVITEMLGSQVITMTGKRFSKQNTKEFTESIETIISLMAEKGCVIPLPREHNFIGDFLEDK